jgi:hypothetical protein
LNVIAQVRAKNIAAKISKNVRHPGQPRSPRAATAIEATANGSANTVCDSLRNPAHRRSAAPGAYARRRMEEKNGMAFHMVAALQKTSAQSSV